MPVSDAAIEGVAGALGAVISLSATYPLLTVSTLKALEHKDVQTALTTILKRLPAPFQPIGEVVEYGKQKGWRALFAGLKPAVVATAVSQGIYFYVYSVLRQIAVAHKRQRLGLSVVPGNGKLEDIGVGASMLVASIAGCVNVMATNPLWVVITQMQALQRRDAATAKNARAPLVARQIWHDQGVQGFWKGLWPSMVMVINPTMQYILYEWLTSRALDWRRRAVPLPGRPGIKLSALDFFLISAVAKIGATLATYPMLVIKNRLQAISRHTEAEAKYTGVLDAVRRMWEAEGYRGFYKGMSMKLVQTVLAAALLMTIKEELYAATHMALAPRKPDRD